MSGILGNFKGTPWPYQKEDGNLLIRRGSLILGHKTGLGKTFISLYGASAFGGERIFITGTKSSLATWLTEVPRWTDGTPMYLGVKTKDLKGEWAKMLMKGQPGIWLMTHSMFQLYMAKHLGKKPWFNTLIEDECHKSKNKNTLLFKALKGVEADHRILASATPTSRGAQDIWAHLNQIDPKNFTSYWRFVNEYCFVDKGAYGTEVEGTRNKEQLRELLKKYYATRRYQDVKAQMPPLRRQVVELEMEPEQVKLYNEMQKTMMLVGEESLVLASGALARDTRLRQIALCPHSLSSDYPVGAGVEYLMEEIPAEDQHTVIFSVYKQVLYSTRKALESQGVKCFMLQGGMEPNEIVEEVRRFKESGGTMLCTIAFAQSFALDTVARAYVLGLDPDPINNIQAEGRLRRGDSNLGPEGVLVRYIIIKGTREEDFKEIVNTKLSNIEKFMPNYSG